jgi:hypothetical protein
MGSAGFDNTSPNRGEGSYMSEEDALKGADVASGTEEGTPVHSPTIPEDEGNPGDGTGEGVAGPASGTTSADGDEDDLTS